jgi:hypothetical protein
MIDPDTRLPVIPVDAPFNIVAGNYATAIFGTMAIVVFLYGLKYWRDTKSPIVLLMMLGGLTTTLIEPLLDVIGLAWHPMHGQNTVFELMGRPIPLWVITVYLMYFGGLGFLNYVAFRRGVTMRVAMLWFAAPMLLDIVMEEIMMHFDLYLYYGQQPLILLWKFPFWWAPCNSMGEYIGVAMLVLMGNSLRGWKLLLIPIIMPIMDCVGYMLVGLPSIVALNTANVSPFMTQAAGVATFVLTAFVVYAVALLIATDSPLRQRGTGRSPLQELFGRTATA